MFKFFRFIEIIVCFQFFLISTMIPVFIKFPFKNNLNIELPITWQIPCIILISLIFKRITVYVGFTSYILVGLFLLPIFHQGGSIGYLLTPNFGYLVGIYPLIKIINNLNKEIKISTKEFIKAGLQAIFVMHITGIFYSFFQVIYYKQINLFLYNIGNYTFGKIGYHLLMLIPIALVLKPINYINSLNRK